MRRPTSATRILTAMVATCAAVGCGGEPSFESAPTAEPDSVRALVTTFWTHYREANTERLAGNWEPAIEAYGEALALRPDHEDALYYLGHTLLEADRPFEARDAWVRLIEVNPSSPRAYLQLGHLALCRTEDAIYDLSAAREAFSMAHSLNREETGSLLRLAEVALADRRPDSAAVFLDAILGAHPDNRDALYLRAYIDHQMDRPSSGEHSLQKVIEAARDRPATPQFSGEGDTRAGSEPIGRKDVDCPSLDGLVPDWSDPPGDFLGAFERTRRVLNRPLPPIE